MKSFSLDTACRLLEKGSWTVVECSREQHLGTPPNTGRLEYAGRHEEPDLFTEDLAARSLVLGCSFGLSRRTMTFSSRSWCAQELSPDCVLLFRTRADDASSDIPSRDADTYVLVKTA